MTETCKTLNIILILVFTLHFEWYDKTCWKIEIQAQFQLNLSLSKLNSQNSKHNETIQIT